MAINAAGATSYFQGHPRGVVWQKAGDPLKEGAITHARRVLSRAVGRALNDSESAYVEGDLVRDEYAVYEQALHMIENGLLSNAEGTAPAFISTDPKAGKGKRSAKQRDPALIAPEARNWLGISSYGLRLSRG